VTSPGRGWRCRTTSRTPRAKPGGRGNARGGTGFGAVRRAGEQRGAGDDGYGDATDHRTPARRDRGPERCRCVPGRTNETDPIAGAPMLKRSRHDRMAGAGRTGIHHAERLNVSAAWIGTERKHTYAIPAFLRFTRSPPTSPRAACRRRSGRRIPRPDRSPGTQTPRVCFGQRRECRWRRRQPTKPSAPVTLSAAARHPDRDQRPGRDRGEVATGAPPHGARGSRPAPPPCIANSWRGMINLGKTHTSSSPMAAGAPISTSARRGTVDPTTHRAPGVLLRSGVSVAAASHPGPSARTREARCAFPPRGTGSPA